jgi:hypothetical protein
MAEYQPPIPNPPNIPFNPSEFLYPSSGGGGLSQAQADARYLIKINPDFASALETFTSGIETTTVEDVTSGSGILSIDSSNILNIGGTTCSTLNIGNPLSNTTLFGNTTYINVTNLEVDDPNILLNKNGLVPTNSGIQIESGGVIVSSLLNDASADWVVNSTNNKLYLDEIQEKTLAHDIVFSSDIGMGGNTIKMAGGEIHNCDLIHGRTNHDITVEAKGTGNLILETDNVTRVTVEDTGDVLLTGSLFVDGSINGGPVDLDINSNSKINFTSGGDVSLVVDYSGADNVVTIDGTNPTFKSNNQPLKINAAGTNALTLQTNTIDRVTVNGSTGNVTLSGDLTVSGGDINGPAAAALNINGGGSNQSIVLTTTGSSGNVDVTTAYGLTTRFTGSNGSVGIPSGLIGTITASDLNLRTNSVNRVTIDGSNGNTEIQSTTQSTSSTTGSLIVDGGIGCNKEINVRNGINSGSTTTVGVQQLNSTTNTITLSAANNNLPNDSFSRTITFPIHRPLVVNTTSTVFSVTFNQNIKGLFMISIKGMITVENNAGQCAARYLLYQGGVAQNTAGTVTTNQTLSTTALFGDTLTFSYGAYSWSIVTSPGLADIRVSQVYGAGSPTLSYVSAECSIINWGGAAGDKDAFITGIILN